MRSLASHDAARDLPAVVDDRRPAPPRPADDRRARGRLENGSLRVTIDLTPGHRQRGRCGRRGLPRPTPRRTATTRRVRNSRKSAGRCRTDASDRMKAQAMRRFIYRYINEDARRRLRDRFGGRPQPRWRLHRARRASRGDAAPRASPAGANGLIFVDQFGTGDKVFGYHMDAALLEGDDGRPVWKTSTPPGPRRWTRHITTSVTDLGEDSMLDAYTTIAAPRGAGDRGGVGGVNASASAAVTIGV